MFWERAYRKAGKIWRQDPHPKVVELAMQLELEGCRRVLDVGCGSGRHCHYLARRGLEAVGIDVSYSALTTARLATETSGLSLALFAQASVDGLPFPNAAFDAAVSYGGVLSFLHNDRLPQAVAEIIRVLKEGGFFLATVFSTADHSYGLGQEIAPRTFQNRDLLCHFFIEEEIQDLFRSLDLIALDHFVIEDTTHDQPHHHGCWQIQARRGERPS